MPGEVITLGCRHCENTVEVNVDHLNDYPGWQLLVPRGTTVSITPVQIALGNELTDRYAEVCPECVPEDGLTICDWCESWIDEEFEPSYSTGTGDIVCLECSEDHAFFCSDCGQLYHYDCSCNVDDDSLVCEDCISNYFYCERCCSYTSNENVRYLEDFIDDLEEDLRDDIDTDYEGLCTYCADDVEWPGTLGTPRPLGTYTRGQSSGIHPWNYKPMDLIVRDVNSLQALYEFAYQRGKSVRLFGWELEIESTAEDEDIRARASYINASHGGNLFYCKSDSSIRNGYEIVSHPATFDYWAGPGREILDELFTQLTGWGYTSWKSGRCGLHIHTNRTAVSRLHVFNLARYMHDKNCTAKLKKLSGRTESQLDGYAKMSLRDLFDRNLGTYTCPSSLEFAKQARHTLLLGDRNRAINISNSNTIELRLFRGSLNMDKFMSSLQFYRTMLEFTNPTGGHLPITTESKWLDYRNYIEDYNQPKAVKELKARLVEAGI